MSKYILLVESPSKVKTLSSYLGQDYQVLATYGHVRDLLPKDGAVDPQKDFHLTWVVDDRAKKYLSQISQAVAQAQGLILATDPDREGEAIAWHVVEWLKENNKLNIPVQRITFNAITRQAVLEGLNNSRDLNDHLIHAYLARRSLDFLVGFNWSPLLWRKLKGSRSAGRVQSVALRLVVERDHEIKTFVSQEYWTIHGIGQKGEGIPVTLHAYQGKVLTREDLPTKTQAQTIIQAIQDASCQVQDVKKRQVSRKPLPPFITSTLQQSAYSTLKMLPSITMRHAQSLYEKGRITYMRTDSTFLSPEGLSLIHQAVKDHYGSEYGLTKPRIFPTKAKNAQEAHEAIRPTQNKPPAQDKTSEEERVYDLIWRRSLACQMAEGQDESLTILVGNDQVQWKATGIRELFDGFRRAWAVEKRQDVLLPDVQVNEPLNITDIEGKQHHTQPPARYHAASLVKKMEEIGIGRPSTYAKIIHTLLDRNYVQQEKGALIPQERGILVTHFLHHTFPHHMDYSFTASLEEKLDNVSQGQCSWKEVLQTFWQEFFQHVQTTTQMDTLDIMTTLQQEIFGQEKSCPQCKTGVLKLKMGHQPFFGCSGYPECQYTENTQGETQKQPEVVGHTPEDHQVMLKQGPHGQYLEVDTGEKKPLRASLPSFLPREELTQEKMTYLLSLPKLLGVWEEDDVTLRLGPYGPYVQWQDVRAPLRPVEKFWSISLEEAQILLENKKNNPSKKRKVAGSKTTPKKITKKTKTTPKKK